MTQRMVTAEREERILRWRLPWRRPRRQPSTVEWSTEVAGTSGETGIEHIGALIARAATEQGRRPAILAPGREALGYDELPGLVGAVAVRLRERGIGADDRVALVTRNGPEAALAFLSLATAAVCAPLNPTYRRNEYDFYLGDLRARAVVVGAGVEEPVRSPRTVLRALAA